MPFIISINLSYIIITQLINKYKYKNIISLSTLSELVDPEILNSSGEVDFFKLKFRDYKSLKDKLDSYCILNYAQLIKRNLTKIMLMKLNIEFMNPFT